MLKETHRATLYPSTFIAEARACLSSDPLRRNSGIFSWLDAQLGPVGALQFSAMLLFDEVEICDPKHRLPANDIALQASEILFAADSKFSIAQKAATLLDDDDRHAIFFEIFETMGVPPDLDTIDLAYEMLSPFS